MEVQKEAQRIMTMSVWKMYHSRLQRGGLRLHRSLQLSLVMRNARDLYLAAKLEEDEDGAEEEAAAAAAAAGPPPLLDLPATPGPRDEEETAAAPPGPGALERLPAAPPAEPEPMETQEGPAPPPRPSRGAAAKPSRKRRRSSLGKRGAAEAGLAPSKKARLGEEGERQPQRQEGPFPSLARVLQDRFAGLVALPAKAAGGGGGEAGCRREDGGGGGGVLSIVVRAVVAF